MPEGTLGWFFFWEQCFVEWCHCCMSLFFFLEHPFKFVGEAAEAREAWCCAIPSARHMARPYLQEHEWCREECSGGGGRSHDRCPCINRLTRVAQKAKQEWDDANPGKNTREISYVPIVFQQH